MEIILLLMSVKFKRASERQHEILPKNFFNQMVFKVVKFFFQTTKFLIKWFSKL